MEGGFMKQTFKRLFSLFLVTVLLCSVFVVSPHEADAATKDRMQSINTIYNKVVKGSPKRYANHVTPIFDAQVSKANNNVTSSAVKWMIKAFTTPGATKVVGNGQWDKNTYSCSTLVTRGYWAAGLTKIPKVTTSSLRNAYADNGFVEVPIVDSDAAAKKAGYTYYVVRSTGKGLILGDVLVNSDEKVKKGSGHTGCYIGTYKGKKNVTIDARRSGDNSVWTSTWNKGTSAKNGKWEHVYRYIGYDSKFIDRCIDAVVHG